MNKRDFAFDKVNYILLAAGMLIVVIGFLLMTVIGVLLFFSIVRVGSFSLFHLGSSNGEFAITAESEQNQRRRSER